MNIYPAMIFIVAGYLVGAIPFGLLYSKTFQREDIRSQGSGNIGATNILRNYGWFPGLSVLFLDALKGAGPVLAVYLLTAAPQTTLAVLTGVAAIVGHIYPVYLEFSGGKGVATSAGVFVILAPLAVAAAFAVFVVMVLITRYISVGSTTAAVVLPLSCVFLADADSAVTLAAAILGITVIWRHRENIHRLISGEEEKFY